MTTCVASAPRTDRVHPRDVGLSPGGLSRIGDVIAARVADGSITGAVTLVARHGCIAHAEAHGAMDRESKRPMARDALFRIASMTKPIAAAAALILADRGALDVEDPVSRFIPELGSVRVAMRASARDASPPALVTLVPADRPISVRHLLTHTSGLMSRGPGHAFGEPLLAERHSQTLAALIPRLCGVPLDFHPGTRWAYSGLAGPDVLGRIVEVVSGEPFDRFLRTKIFDPLGMHDTCFYPSAAQRRRLVTLYQRDGDRVVRDPNQDGRFSSPTYFSAGAGLISTAGDYLRFALMLLNGGILGGQRVLSPDSVAAMTTNQVGDLIASGHARTTKGSQGFGYLTSVMLDPAAARRRATRGSFGSHGMYGTQIWVEPSLDLVTVLMTQEPHDQLERDLEDIVMGSVVDAAGVR